MHDTSCWCLMRCDVVIQKDVVHLTHRGDTWSFVKVVDPVTLTTAERDGVTEIDYGLHLPLFDSGFP